MTAADGWCPACLTAPAPDADRAPRHTAVAAPLTTQVGGRAGRSQITFGPIGRSLWTFGILVVPVPFLWISDGYAGWGLAALWWGVVTPWSLRDLWRSGRRTRRL
ncbi:MAG: hypothetical protein ACRDTP_11835 [Mycobacteriales bacterium]